MMLLHGNVIINFYSEVVLLITAIRNVHAIELMLISYLHNAFNVLQLSETWEEHFVFSLSMPC